MALEFHSEPALTIDYLAFNMAKAPFATEPRLRRALSMVIDRQALVDKVIKTDAPIEYSIVPSVGLPGYVDQSADWGWLSMDDKIVEAQDLYKAAGYGTARPLQVELRIVARDNIRKIAVAIAEMWQRTLGVQTSIVAEDFNTLVEHREHKSPDLQIFGYSWTADYPDPTTFLNLFISNSSQNDTSYNNPAYDRLVEAAARTVDESRRIGLLQDAEEILVNDNPVIPLYSSTQRYLAKPWVRGYHIDPCGLTYDRDVTIMPH